MDMTPARPATVTGRVALLVDAENLSVTLAPRILTLAAVMGQVTVRRAYGKPAHVAEWETHGFRLIPASAAKNSADLALCVDAMTLALREEFPTLVIASSDRDFSPLAVQLRELGFLVVGMGDGKAPVSLRRACSSFVEIGAPMASPATPKAPVKAIVAPPKPPVAPLGPKPQAKSALNPTVDETARRLCRAEGDASSKMVFSTLCHRLAAEGVSRKATGRATWSSYFRGHPGFHLTGEGGSMAIRPR